MAVVKNAETLDGEDHTIFIEVESDIPESSPYRALNHENKTIYKTKELFEKGLTLSRNCATKVVESMKLMKDEVRPNEYQLQISVKLDTNVGAVLAKAGSEAQLIVKMTWKSNE